MRLCSFRTIFSGEGRKKRVLSLFPPSCQPFSSFPLLRDPAQKIVHPRRGRQKGLQCSLHSDPACPPSRSLAAGTQKNHLSYRSACSAGERALVCGGAAWRQGGERREWAGGRWSGGSHRCPRRREEEEEEGCPIGHAGISPPSSLFLPCPDWTFSSRRRGKKWAGKRRRKKKREREVAMGQRKIFTTLANVEEVFFFVPVRK